jgi:hypothetical protein
MTRHVSREAKLTVAVADDPVNNTDERLFTVNVEVAAEPKALDVTVVAETLVNVPSVAEILAIAPMANVPPAARRPITASRMRRGCIENDEIRLLAYECNTAEKIKKPPEIERPPANSSRPKPYE